MPADLKNALDGFDPSSPRANGPFSAQRLAIKQSFNDLRAKYASASLRNKLLMVGGALAVGAGFAGISVISFGAPLAVPVGIGAAAGVALVGAGIAEYVRRRKVREFDQAEKAKLDSLGTDEDPIERELDNSPVAEQAQVQEAPAPAPTQRNEDWMNDQPVATPPAPAPSVPPRVEVRDVVPVAPKEVQIGYYGGNPESSLLVDKDLGPFVTEDQAFTGILKHEYGQYWLLAPERQMWNGGSTENGIANGRDIRLDPKKLKLLGIDMQDFKSWEGSCVSVGMKGLVKAVPSEDQKDVMEEMVADAEEIANGREDSGYDSGHDSGHNSGHDSGYDSGHDSGYGSSGDDRDATKKFGGRGESDTYGVSGAPYKTQGASTVSKPITIDGVVVHNQEEWEEKIAEKIAADSIGNDEAAKVLVTLRDRVNEKVFERILQRLPVPKAKEIAQDQLSALRLAEDNIQANAERHRLYGHLKERNYFAANRVLNENKLAALRTVANEFGPIGGAAGAVVADPIGDVIKHAFNGDNNTAGLFNTPANRTALFTNAQGAIAGGGVRYAHALPAAGAANPAQAGLPIVPPPAAVAPGAPCLARYPTITHDIANDAVGHAMARLVATGRADPAYMNTIEGHMDWVNALRNGFPAAVVPNNDILGFLRDDANPFMTRAHVAVLGISELVRDGNTTPNPNAGGGVVAGGYLAPSGPLNVANTAQLDTHMRTLTQAHGLTTTDASKAALREAQRKVELAKTLSAIKTGSAGLLPESASVKPLLGNLVKHEARDLAQVVNALGTVVPQNLSAGKTILVEADSANSTKGALAWGLIPNKEPYLTAQAEELQSCYGWLGTGGILNTQALPLGENHETNIARMAKLITDKTIAARSDARQNIRTDPLSQEWNAYLSSDTLKGLGVARTDASKAQRFQSL